MRMGPRKRLATRRCLGRRRGAEPSRGVEQNSALALFCAGSASTAEQGRRPRRLRQRRGAKRLPTTRLFLASKFAIRLRAITVERKSVSMQTEAARGCYVVLPVFYFRIDKLFDAPAGEAHQMVMMCAFIELKHGAAALEVVARQQPGLLKLS